MAQESFHLTPSIRERLIRAAVFRRNAGFNGIIGLRENLSPKTSKAFVLYGSCLSGPQRVASEAHNPRWSLCVCFVCFPELIMSNLKNRSLAVSSAGEQPL